jgi:hypothetical protein
VRPTISLTALFLSISFQLFQKIKTFIAQVDYLYHYEASKVESVLSRSTKIGVRSDQAYANG